MADQGRDRRALPPPLWLGLGLKATAIGHVVVASGDQPSSGWWALTAEGIGVTAMVLLGAGLLMLAGRHEGRARRGLQVAGVSWGVLALLQVVTALIFEAHWGVAFGVRVVQLGFGVALLCGTTGLAVAVWHWRPALGAVCVAQMIVGALAVFLGTMSGLASGYRGVIVVDGIVGLTRLGVIAAIAIALAGTPQRVEPASTAGALRRAARALRFAVGVMICVTATLVLFGTRGPASTTVSTVAGCLALVAGSVMFAWLGFSLLGAARERGGAVAAYPLAVAAAIAVWCGRMLLRVVPAMCREARSAGDEDVVAQVLLGTPVGVVIGAAVLAAAIGGFARRHGIDDLRRRGYRHAAGVLGAALAVPMVMVAAYDLHPSLAALVLVIVCCAQTVLLARLCEAAAGVVDGGAALPQVRVISA